MKRLLLLILTSLYLVSTSGMQLQRHFCMGKLQETSLGFTETKECGTCGMASGHSDCCHDESQWFQVNDDHGAAVTAYHLPLPFVLQLPPVQHYWLHQPVQAAPEILVSNHSPPPLFLPPLHILFCSYRI